MAGAIDNPAKLKTVLQSHRVVPGDVFWIRGGTYRDDFECTLVGTEAQPIILKPYPGERVIIDGSLNIKGAHTHWYDIEKTQTGNVRHTEETGSSPAIEGGECYLYGQGVELYNWIIYNQNSNGIGWWGPASGAKLSGCVMFDNGWSAPDRGHGHGIYTQNYPENANKVMRHCILAQQFGADSSNLALYGSGAAGLQHYRISESVFISGRHLIGGDAPVDDVEVEDCHLWGTTMLGYHDDDHENTILRRCRMAGADKPFSPVYMRRYGLFDSIMTLTGNSKMVYSQEPRLGLLGYSASGNAYHNLGNDTTPFQVETVGHYNLVGWQARYNCDLDSTYQTTPPADSSHVYPNEYDANRGIIVVWNWSEAESVVVDVSSITGLPADENYRLRSAVNYFGDTVTGTVAPDGTITIDMRAISHSVSIPTNWETALMENPFPRFGTFIVEKA